MKWYTTPKSHKIINQTKANQRSNHVTRFILPISDLGSFLCDYYFSAYPLGIRKVLYKTQIGGRFWEMLMFVKVFRLYAYTHGFVTTFQIKFKMNFFIQLFGCFDIELIGLDSNMNETKTKKLSNEKHRKLLNSAQIFLSIQYFGPKYSLFLKLFFK